MRALAGQHQQQCAHWPAGGPSSCGRQRSRAAAVVPRRAAVVVSAAGGWPAAAHPTAQQGLCQQQQQALQQQPQQMQVLQLRTHGSRHVCRARAAASTTVTSSASPPSLPWPMGTSSNSSSSSRASSRHRQVQAAAAAGGGGQPPADGDPWRSSSPRAGSPAASGDDWGSSGSVGVGAPPPPPPPPPPPGSNGQDWDAAAAAAAAAAGGQQPANGGPNYSQTDWGWTAAPEDWDPSAGLAPGQLADMEADYLEQLARRRGGSDPPRDKWITPLLDWQSVYGAFDPDQSRTEDAMADEALTNKEESREALSFLGRLVVIPLVTGALISRAITGPVLSFSLQNNPNAFALTEHQKLEGATALHMEETRLKMMMAIGQIPPLDERGMLGHLHEFALEFQEEEREKNEAALMTLVSDSISASIFFIMFARDTESRAALFSTIGRLFEGLSDIAKAVLIILVADTLLGYHSEEGWTGFLDLVLGHYGIEVEEENIVLFVGVIPIAIDVLFKYWIFIGLNRISPGAVVTIKQLDRH